MILMDFNQFKENVMKNFKNTILLLIGGILLSTLVSLDTTTAQTKTEQMQQTSAKMIKCKFNDSDCFIRAADTCRKATFTTNKSMLDGVMNPNVPHPTYTQTTRYEIRGGTNDKCLFYSKVEKADVKFGEDYIKYVMKSNQETRTQTEYQLSETRKTIQQQVGKYGLCSFHTEKLVTMLNGWWQKDGSISFSSKDFESADCQGTLYNFTLPNQNIKMLKLNSVRTRQK
jgi:hypothetical protein